MSCLVDVQEWQEEGAMYKHYAKILWMGLIMYSASTIKVNTIETKMSELHCQKVLTRLLLMHSSDS